MPPILSRKRVQSDSPIPEPPPKRARAPKAPASKPPAPKPPPRRTKQSVFDAPPKVNRTLSQTKKFLEGSDNDSELSDADSSDDDEFEDVPLSNTNKGKRKANTKTQEASDSDESEEDDWEDALGVQHHTKHDAGPDPKISGDIALTLSAAPKAAFDSKPDGKKGPSKVQRQIRNVTHCMHVQALMFHNLMRNSWIEDKEVQKTLVEGLTSGCWREVEQYWRDAGVPDGLDRAIVQRKPQRTPEKTKNDAKKDLKDKKGKWKDSGSNGVKVYDTPDNKLSKQRKEEARREYEATLARDEILGSSERKQCDWGAKSKRMEPETPNMAHGDPLLRLLKYLSAYWKARWRTTAPTLRKRGYLSPSTLQAEMDAWKEHGSHADSFGERIENREAFREMARKCEGSKDAGQQLFTALIRGLGIEARMIVSLQPAGFGFSQAEEGRPKNLEKLKDLAKHAPNNVAVKRTPSKPPSAKKISGKHPVSPQNRRKVVASSGSDSDSSDLSSVISISSDTGDDKQAKKTSNTRDYKDDLPYPTYWTEVISNLTHTPVSVSPLSRTVIASSAIPEKYSDFYARGAAADKAKQVLAYLIAFSSDGTAKDVTTRYLPKNQWPGRTKGFRMPIEKIPIHNKRGKVKRWEEWDWFKSVMRPFARPHNKRQPWDEVEEEGDLVPAEPEKKKTMDEEGGKETLQGYKSSTEYVLERHLRREEALKPGAKIVRHFAISKKGEEDKLEPVYRRKDVVNCKTTESWHKEGREVKPGEQPLKYVPMRAVTKTRKLEIEERERIEGGKVQQGLYAKNQTDWIIPEPIKDGIIPVNAFNNIDVYVPTMVPKGAVHIPLKGTARVCRKLNINYAEACTGFEFGKQRAVPVITGVVVAEENEHLVIDAWEAEEAEKARKEAEKRQKFVLGLWKKFYSGLKIVQRMKDEYGEEAELPQKDLYAPVEKKAESEWEVFRKHQGKDFEGGFLREEPAGGGFVQQPTSVAGHDVDMSGGFFPASQEEVTHGDLTIDLGDRDEQKRTPAADTAFRKPISLSAAVENPTEEDDDDKDDSELDAAHNPDIKEATNVESGEDEDEDSEDDKPLVPPRRKSTTTLKPTTIRSKRSSTAAKRRSILECSDEESLSDAPFDPRTPPPATRSAPKRKAARKSDAQVKSHFFAMGSEEETDATDFTERASPKKKGSTRRRGKAGRGR
jgi:xeroderma pigmentosum group C-complementing protein